MFQQKRVALTLKQVLPALVLLMLSACVASPPRYIAPAGLTTQNAAILTGSETRTPATLLPNAFVAASAIDGESVSSRWNKPILLLPGDHTVQFGPCLCNTWFLSPSSGSVALVTNFKPNQSYVMRSTIPSSFYASRTAQVWIQTAAGALVTPKVMIPFVNQPTPMIIFQPVSVK